jgi:hypothetical protein
MPGIYLIMDGRQQGPYSPEQVRQLLAAGGVIGTAPAWFEGLTEWSTVSAVLVSVTPGLPPAPLPPVPPSPKGKGLGGWAIAAIICGAVFVLALPCCAGIALGPIKNGIEKAKENAAVQHERAIAGAMLAYAGDHSGNYPDADETSAGQSLLKIGGGSNPSGASTSTEVFQKLIDGNYVADPTLFYIAMPGKVRPVGNRLTADNVCFDVTAGLTSSSPSGVPIVFTTGFSVSYGNTMRVTRDGVSPFPAFIALYTGKSGRYLKLAQGESAVIGPLFTLFGSHYRQLKP